MPKSPAATPVAIVDTLQAVAGHPPQARASFAKGQCVHGTYVPSDQAEDITRSPSFTRASRVLARFSLGGGDPSVADNNGRVLRGFSFRLGDRAHRSDILTQNAPVHFARTPAQMLAYLRARISGPDGRLDGEKVSAFSAANPETLNQANYIAARPLPGSFAGTTYWGVHAFAATNAKGQTRFIKFKIVPVGGEITLTEAQAARKPANFLHDDLERQIAAGHARFSVTAVLDRPGDPIMDVTIRWPDEDARETVRLGTIVITSIEANEQCDAGIFDPAHLADGIGHPPDEIFAARQAAYKVSLARRH